jgi:DMSO/TMAO reductase YedYZ molybdopterin-dependent catalytic subunit
MLKSYDGYSTNLPLADIDREDVLIAHTWQGQPLTREHGGPVRLVVPHLYFWKSAKWLRHITFMDQDQPGYWEARGYHMRGDPWREERYG